MSMICNKKAYPAMRKDCENCSENEACFSGYAVGASYMENASEKLEQPLMRETTTLNVGGNLVPVYKDDLKKEIYKALREPFSLMYGA